MRFITEAEVLNALQEHLSAFVEIVQGGWDDYLAYPIDQRIVYTTTTRAGIVHDHQIERASRYAASSQEVSIRDCYRLKLLVVEVKDCCFAIRIKKLNEMRMPSNHLTGQVADFRRQRQLDGIPSSYNLEIGYVLDRLESEIKEVCLVYPRGSKSNYWVSELSKEGADTRARTMDIFQHRKFEEGVEEEESTIVRPKRDGKIIPLKRETDED